MPQLAPSLAGFRTLRVKGAFRENLLVNSKPKPRRRETPDRRSIRAALDIKLPSICRSMTSPGVSLCCTACHCGLKVSPHVTRLICRVCIKIYESKRGGAGIRLLQARPSQRSLSQAADGGTSPRSTLLQTKLDLHRPCRGISTARKTFARKCVDRDEQESFGLVNAVFFSHVEYGGCSNRA